jgi:hypothetical protein
MSDSLPAAPILQVSHIWRDEVMENMLFTEESPVTLGTTSLSTFVTPDMGLPADFALFRPGARGYVMTLGAGMDGDLQLNQKKQKVTEFVGGVSSDMAEPGGFRGTAIAPGDFGVIKLSGEHEHSIFFQFVKPAPLLPKGRLVRDPELLLPAFAFAAVLIGFFLIYALAFYDYAGNGFLWPGRRELVANYLLNRPLPPVEEEEIKVGKEDAEDEVKPASTTGEEAKSGGEGDKERKRAEDPDKGEPDEALPTEIQVGLLSKKSRKTFDKIRNRGGFDEKLGKALARMQGPANDGSAMGFGDGKGTGVGTGKGTGTSTKGTGKGVGGGGSAHGDVKTQGALNTGGKRVGKGVSGGNSVKEVKVKMKTGKPSGSFGGLTHEQIMKVVRTRARAIQACYSRELQRNKGLGGKIIVNWKIDSGGKVSRTKVRTTTMKNGRVEDCVVRQVNSMKFPSPKGGGSATVNFPFIFGQQ